MLRLVLLAATLCAARPPFEVHPLAAYGGNMIRVGVVYTGATTISGNGFIYIDTKNPGSDKIAHWEMGFDGASFKYLGDSVQFDRGTSMNVNPKITVNVVWISGDIRDSIVYATTGDQYRPFAGSNNDYQVFRELIPLSISPRLGAFDPHEASLSFLANGQYLRGLHKGAWIFQRK